MHAKILGCKRISREFIAVILFGAYVIFYHTPILAEYMDISKEKRITTDLVSGKNEPISEQNNWFTVKGAYFTIYYSPAVNLKSVEKKLRRRRFYFDEGLSPGYLSKPEEKIAHRMDMLFKRVEEILDMYPHNMNVKLKIFKSQRDLDVEYYRIFEERRTLKSFYVYKHDTIYTCERNISDSVMAHEIGHAVIDHYFLILPPEEIKEILACYVDEHLEE